MTMGGVFLSFVKHFMILLSLLTEVSGNKKYFNVGGKAILPCNNVVNPGNCNSTTWNYQGPGYQIVIEEVRLGNVKKGNNPNRADRLSVGSDCSLHVSDVRAEDAGTYTCRQYLTEGGGQHGRDEAVYLSLLNISSSTPVTELKSDETVTLRCHLHTFDGKCDSYIISNVTVNLYETGTNLRGDSRHQVTQHSPCDVTLNVTLLRADRKRTWMCQLTEKGLVKTSVDLTVPGSSLPFNVGVVVGVSMGVAVCVIAAVIILHRRRTKNQMPADSKIVLTAVNHQPSPPANEDKSQTAERINYASIKHFNQKKTSNIDVHGEDTVTYASVITSSDREREPKNPADHSSLYATVN